MPSRVLTSSFRAFGKKRRRKRKRNGSSGGEKASWLLLFRRRRLGARGSRRRGENHIYTLYILLKNVVVVEFLFFVWFGVCFWCVFGELFFTILHARDFFLPQNTHTLLVVDRHTHFFSSCMCVSVCVCGVIVV